MNKGGFFCTRLLGRLLPSHLTFLENINARTSLHITRITKTDVIFAMKAVDSDRVRSVFHNDLGSLDAKIHEIE